MEYGIVVKVKYGDTLRRFAASVNEVLGVIDLNMIDLRAKSLNFFNLNPDTDITFTYVDEDGDVVTLGDDNDLRDAVIGQHLNPLRINVLTKFSEPEASNSRMPFESSTSTRSPRVQIEPPSPISAGVEDSLKSVPEPFRSTLLKLSNDLISKAASSAPVLTELVEYYSKLGPLSQRQEGAALNTPGNSSDCAMDLNVTAGFEVSNDPISSSKVIPNASLVDKSSVDNPKGYDGGNMARGVRISAPSSTSVDLNVDLPGEDFFMLGCSSVNVPVHDGNSAAAVSSFTPQVDHLMDFNPYPSQTSETLKQSVPQAYDGIISSGEKNKQSPHGVEPSASQVGFNPQNNCPFNSVIGAGASDVTSGGLYPTVHPFKINYDFNESMLRTFHRGIQCDGCGMLPIMGPRFKSKVKDDYDLCNICFVEMGNEADYTRIDRATYQPRIFCPHPRFQGPYSPALRGRGVKPCKPKLESRFIQDVTILDGTLMAQNAPFTKIWRMRNNGTTVWPPGTRLVWIGGIALGDRRSVELEIPANGCPVNEELDMAVDFTAPSRPGRYISYWRMTSPSGQKFGQRVWVLIQVDSGLSSLSDRFRTGLNLNMPPESNGQQGKGIIIDVNLEPMDGAPFIPDPSHVAAELVKPVVDEPLIKNEGLDFQVDKGSLVGGNGVAPPVSESSARVSYPIIDFSEPSPAAEVPAPPSVVNLVDPAEHILLKELEEMGFKQTDLNKEILRNNNYDLEQSVVDLCDFSEWDPLLEELQEMGFGDRQMNKKLLIKNGGSIKRVVLDLIAGEKA